MPPVPLFHPTTPHPHSNSFHRTEHKRATAETTTMQSYKNLPGSSDNNNSSTAAPAPQPSAPSPLPTAEGSAPAVEALVTLARTRTSTTAPGQKQGEKESG